MLSERQTIKTGTGFTIIEVVLVLAIAGLIFLMVFVALPALQRSQRDTQKREDVSRVASALTQHQTNNSGSLPTATVADLKVCSTSSSNKTSLNDPFRKNYLDGGNFKNPQGTAYTIYACKMDTDNKYWAFTTLSYIFVYSNAKCDSEKPVYSAGDRNYAVVSKLEGPGYYCLDNS